MVIITMLRFLLRNYANKLFPKENSFQTSNQELASVVDFCAKIKASKDHQSDDSFSVIARTEALVSGKGISFALERAHKYYEAGADAILIHSKSSDGCEVVQFAKEWNNLIPLVIIPTTYYKTSSFVFKDLNISLIIWANHLLRASMQSMIDVGKKIFKEQNVSCVNSSIISIDDIFDILNYKQVESDKKKYLNKHWKT